MTIDNVMRHGAYEAAITFDAAAGLFNGEVINLRDVVTFQGTSIDELRQAFAASIADYLALCAARGEPSESPFSRTVTGEWDSDDHHAVEAARLLAQASRGGLRFDAYFGPADAAWALGEIERGRILSPSDVVFVATQVFRELQNYPDLKEELLRREIQKAIDDPRPSAPAKEAFARLKRKMAEMEKHKPAVWHKPDFS